MRKLGAYTGAVAAGLALVLCRPAAAEDPGGKLSPWSHLFGGSKPDAKKEDPAAAARASEARKKADIRRAYADLLRRWAVCDRLREIASQKDDLEALKLADMLSDRAWAVYDKKARPSAGTTGGFVAEGFESGGDLLPREANKRGSAGREKP